jgi:hypothetical protein
MPEGGPSPDTPGTYAEVSPKELRPGATIQFVVSGYPAGETLNIKIDDGAGYSDTTTAGSGVVHTQAIGASGSTSGSLRLPSDISEGWHWLRFLASEVVEGKGVLGYTNGAGSASNTSHLTAFYVAGETLGGATAEESVVAGTSPGAVDATQGRSGSTGGSGSSGTGGSTSTSGGAGSTSGGASGAGDSGDGTGAAMSDEEAAAAAAGALLGDGVVADASGVGASGTTGTSGTATRSVAGGSTPTGAGSDSAGIPIPLPGLITLGAVAVVGIALMLIVMLRRPRSAVAAGALDSAERVGDGHSFGGGFGEGFDPGVDVVEPTVAPVAADSTTTVPASASAMSAALIPASAATGTAAANPAVATSAPAVPAASGDAVPAMPA